MEGLREHCTGCRQETSHEVWIEIKKESPKTKEENVEFSREPYRVAECTACGTTTTKRMNNA